MRKNLWHFFLGSVFAFNALAVVFSVVLDKVDFLTGLNFIAAALCLVFMVNDE